MQVPLEQHLAQHHLAHQPMQLAQHLLPLQVQTHRYTSRTPLVSA